MIRRQPLRKSSASWEKNKRQEKGQKRQSECWLICAPPAGLQRSYKTSNGLLGWIDWPTSRDHWQNPRKLLEIVDSLAGQTARTLMPVINPPDRMPPLPSGHLMDMWSLLFAVVIMHAIWVLQPGLPGPDSNRFVSGSPYEYQRRLPG
jgi:hypothetical protein